MVITRFSAHHWLDVTAALHEVRRVLKPNGVFIIIDITAPETPLRDSSHVRDYRPPEWMQMLREAGNVRLFRGAA